MFWLFLEFNLTNIVSKIIVIKFVIIVINKMICLIVVFFKLFFFNVGIIIFKEIVEIIKVMNIVLFMNFSYMNSNDRV